MRLKLYIQVYLLRLVQSLSAWVERTLIKPRPITPAFRVNIPMKQQPGNISLYFYLPKGLQQMVKKDLPLIVNFHAGGFVIGNPQDDARWADAILSKIDAVFVSVGYRKGPEYPQPIAVMDGVDALGWLWNNAAQYGYDISRTIITGFSSGGNMTFTVPLMLNRLFPTTEGTIAGLVAYYPSVNQAIPRADKFASNPLSEGSEPTWLHQIIDESYYQNLADAGRASINLSQL